MPNKKSTKKSIKKSINKRITKRITKRKSKYLIQKTKNKKIYGGNFESIDDYLTDIEKEALKTYTSGQDLFVNKVLRIDDNYKDFYDTLNNQEIYDKNLKIKETIEKIIIIDNIMKSKATIVNDDLIVYRGTQNKKEDEPYLGINKGYISTSKSLNAIQKNSWRFLSQTDNCCLYIYTIKKNVPYINLSKISYFGEGNESNQEEILLPRGLKTTLVSTNITEMYDQPYKTYNVTIELNNQEKYDIEPIENSSIIIKMVEVFDLLKAIEETGGLVYTFLYNLAVSKKYSKDENDEIINTRDTDDFNEVFEKTIDDILLMKQPFGDLIHDYRDYVNELFEEFAKLEFLKDEDKSELNKLEQEINSKVDIIENNYS
jgi:hypothetical protein